MEGATISGRRAASAILAQADVLVNSGDRVLMSL
jgi:hypothetical protein